MREVKHFEVPSAANERHRTDDHDGEDANESDASDVGYAGNETEDSRPHSEYPLVIRPRTTVTFGEVAHLA